MEKDMKLIHFCVTTFICIVLFACGEDNPSTPIQDSETNSVSSQSIKSSQSIESSSSTIQISPVTSLTDPRDGQTYRVVTIGTQTWMAENLNYRYLQKTATLDSSSFCYNDSTKYCEKFGRLYMWSAAMDSVGEFSTTGKGCGSIMACKPTYPVQGVCPDGWHLPTYDEYQTLDSAVGGKEAKSGLKLMSTTDWDMKNYVATDDYGFSILPAGALYDTSYFGLLTHANFWTSSIHDHGNSWQVYFDRNYSILQATYYKNRMSYSVRCIKNDNRVLSSSSIAESSSSVPILLPCKTAEKDECEYGTLIDERDNKTYKTVKIGTQTWMAENLNFATGASYCNKNVDTNCKKYGRYYTWETVMDGRGTYSNNAIGCKEDSICSPKYPVPGICPDGWHVPTKDEFETLYEITTQLFTSNYALKSSYGWNNDGNGIDAFGFSVLPAGDRYERKYDSEGKDAFLWTATQYENNNNIYAYAILFSQDNSEWAYFTREPKDAAASLRCIKD